ncbi:RHS repeat-associated core domain-containing protein [Luteolibacter ambystomatis]|uniref:RHS repeat-associated core domain-containing protein n=1 Tax=Luteolibacter ambystomatis TaxID=2824561 RepID=A0A975PH91_9BACT|nr:RHS repeat-associated core domain-containing protein [Luteolibacter ambystomatis]QUE53082.1 RHS repeat-associated core domain-containing protein [Luteolibacter ambystomatis]
MKPGNRKKIVPTMVCAIGLPGLASAASVEKYKYDAAGNVIEKSIGNQTTQFCYDASNQLVSKNQERILYDNAGRMLAVTDASGNKIRQTEYGYADKVIATISNQGEAGFFYNAEGRLVGKCLGGEMSSYAWDGDVLAAEGNSTFANERQSSGGVPILAGIDQIVVSDYLGNTLISGESVFSSTAFGEGLENGRFTGKPFVKELGSYVFLHRNYSATTLRWTSRDPLGFPDGENSYAYVNGDPLSEVDAYGLMTVNPASLGTTPQVPTTGSYAKTVGGTTYHYKISFTGHDATCADGSTPAIVWTTPVITPVAPTTAMTAAEKASVAAYYAQNCHGYTLGVNGWINDGSAGWAVQSIETIIKGEGYKKTTDQNDQAKIVTWGTVTHSAKVSSYNAGKVKEITHKDNDVTTGPVGPIPVGGTNYGAVKEYWEK